MKETYISNMPQLLPAHGYLSPSPASATGFTEPQGFLEGAAKEQLSQAELPL